MPVPPDVVITEIVRLTAKARDLIEQCHTISVKYDQNLFAVELCLVQKRLDLAVEGFRKSVPQPQPCSPPAKRRSRGSRGGRKVGHGKKQASSEETNLPPSSGVDRVQPPKSQVDGVNPSPVQAPTTAPRTIHALPARVGTVKPSPVRAPTTAPRTIHALPARVDTVKPSPVRAPTTAPRTIHALPARVDTRTIGQPPTAQPAVSQPKGALVDFIDFTSDMRAVKVPTNVLQSMQTEPVRCSPSTPTSTTKANHPSQLAKKKPSAPGFTKMPAAECDTRNVSTNLVKHVRTTGSGLAPPIGVVKTSLDISTVGNSQSDHGTASLACPVMIDQCNNSAVLIDLEDETELIRPNPILITAMRTDRGASKASDSH